jgi:hypothetical protein
MVKSKFISNEIIHAKPRLIFLTGLVLISIVSISTAQTRLNSVDGVFIERNNQNKPSSPDSAGKVPRYEPLMISENEIMDGDVIAFDIPGFNDYLRENKKLLKNVTIKIDQIELPEFNAYIENAESDVVRFRFSNSNLTYNNRILLYKLPGKSTKKVLLGIKLDESNILYYYEPAKIFFNEIKRWGNIGWISIILFFLFFILLIFKYQSMIKDSVSYITEEKDLKTYFSFSKSQFAFWTFIIISSFIYIWALTGDLNSINNTALILLGITSITIVTSNLINIDEEKHALSAQSTMNLLDSRIKGPEEKSNFFQDILSDADGISIHRLQAFVFNLVFGMAFFKSVFFNYTMPEFSTAQLILLGLSNGTYAFLKKTENK